MVYIVVMTEHWFVTDGWTHGRTGVWTQGHSTYHSSIALQGKNCGIGKLTGLDTSAFSSHNVIIQNQFLNNILARIQKSKPG